MQSTTSPVIPTPSTALVMATSAGIYQRSIQAKNAAVIREDKGETRKGGEYVANLSTGCEQPRERGSFSKELSDV